ncbi:hypothetical protein ACFW2V_02750 [Streptomyces sp. NPDC058947]|uniref:hypothetical protein n=1 Tax=Streptomyces sp. NPDC058947 TaxID=3346675 RepID=UPI0036747E94
MKRQYWYTATVLNTETKETSQVSGEVSVAATPTSRSDAEAWVRANAAGGAPRSVVTDWDVQRAD